MASVNKVIVLGNLGKDPEIRYTSSGSAVATLSIATVRKYKDSNDQKQEETEWHRVVLFGRLAEIAGEYVKKGHPLYVEGRLRTQKWQDKEGNDRYTTEIVGESIQLLAPKSSDEERPAKPSKPSRPAPRKESTMPEDDDIPF